MPISRNDIHSGHRTAAVFTAPGGGGLLIHTGPLAIFSVCLAAGGSNTGAINLFDNTSAAGDVLRYSTPQDTSTQQEWEDNGIQFNNGLFVTATAAKAGWFAVITYLAE